MKIIKTHISLIKASDTVIHEGELKTVSNSNITINFCGISLWGDSYHAGNKLVEKVVDFN